MRQKRLVGIYLVGVMIFIALISLAAKELSSYAAENKVQPTEYFPLAVGSYWTYVWENKPSHDKHDPSDKAYSRIFSANVFKSDYALTRVPNRSKLAQPVTVRETYTITKEVKGVFFLKFSCEGQACRDHNFGDGRFIYAQLVAWSWRNLPIQGKPAKVFSEIIATKNYPGMPVVNELVTDISDILSVKRNLLSWDYENYSYPDNDLTVVMDFSDHSVTVPAGKFDHCILVKEIYSWESEKFIVYRFYAPGVGKVQEYQELEDGTITYVMSLEKYDLVK